MGRPVGIVSFIFSMLAASAAFGAFLINSFAQLPIEEMMESDTSTKNITNLIVLTGFIIIGAICSVIGFVLSVSGLITKRGWLFAFLGLVFSLVSFAYCGYLFITDNIVAIFTNGASLVGG